MCLILHEEIKVYWGFKGQKNGKSVLV